MLINITFGASHVRKSNFARCRLSLRRCLNIERGEASPLTKIGLAELSIKKSNAKVYNT